MQPTQEESHENLIISTLFFLTLCIADRFSLHQNYPNPFNPQTTIAYSLSRTSAITLRVYDPTGREVATLARNERKAAGKHEVSFDATRLPSGIYFYRLQTESFVETKKMLLIR
jgi:hypothetical protein